MQVATIIHTVISYNHPVTKNGSKKNGTVAEVKMLAAITNMLYLCYMFC